MARIFDRRNKSGQFGGSPAPIPGTDIASDGTAAGLNAVQTARVLLEYASVSEIGYLGVYNVEAVAGNAATTITVPAGKYWRLVGISTLLVTDANVANRAVTILTRTSVPATLDTIVHEDVAASTTAKRTTLFGVDDYVVGNEAVAAQGTLTIDTLAAEDEVIVLNGVTLTWKDALTQGVENELLVNTDEAGTKATLEAALVDRDNGGVLHSISDATYASFEMTAIAFAGDDMVFTANVKGVAGDALATTTTMAGGSNAWGATTLGDTTAGVDAADKLGTLDFPTDGNLLSPAQDVYVTVDAGVAGDDLDIVLFYVEYSADPAP